MFKSFPALKTLILVAVGLFLAIQLVPVWLWQTNPPVVAQPAWDSPQTRAMVKRVCFDCHSNETVWPFYARIAPSSWLVTRDVVQARNAMNFSEWDTKSLEVDEISQVINEGEMPPGQYLLLHPEARLSEAEKQQLVQGMANSIR